MSVQMWQTKHELTIFQIHKYFSGGAMLNMGNLDRPRDRPQRRSLQLLPSRPGFPEKDPPSRTHKHCLAVEEVNYMRHMC